MKLMRRNLQTIYYRLYEGQQPKLDADGYETGETAVSYSDPLSLLCSVSPASGDILADTFGTLEQYDKVIITDDLSCKMNESSILYLETDVTGKHDYVVNRVARSLNFIAYAVSKVNTS